MSTNAESDAKTVAALAVNLSRLLNLLSVAAKSGTEAYELIQRGERDRAISVLLGVDVVLDDSKVLLGSAIAPHREKAVSDDSHDETRPSVIGLLTAEDLVYVHKLLEAGARSGKCITGGVAAFARRDAGGYLPPDRRPTDRGSEP